MKLIHRSDLQDLHPYLYKRVRLKGIVFTVYGFLLTLIGKVSFLTPVATGQGGIGSIITPQHLGWVWIAIGLGIFWGLYASPSSYRKARIALYAGFYWALFWYFGIITALFFGYQRQAAIIVLFGYLVYNLRIILTDTGWAGAELIKEIRNGREQ